MAQATELTDYEIARERRIADNKKKMAELGLQQAVDEVVASQQAVQQETKDRRDAGRKRKAADADQEPAEQRKSSRQRSEVNYAEDSFFPKPAKVERERPVPDSLKLDLATAEQLRQQVSSRAASGKGTGPSKKRGPVDSGKGVRVQGGRVYDSSLGVTCHWCRQKTLEDHVICSNEGCGGGKRMPYAFCKMCLRNRHGEDVAEAAASGQWECPVCRGSCGAGCITCCNCGPCRKKAGLGPTHQVKSLARAAGFNNVHDYLVHLVTGEAQQEIAARKVQFTWGAWMSGHAGCSTGQHQDLQDKACKRSSEGRYKKAEQHVEDKEAGQQQQVQQQPMHKAAANTAAQDVARTSRDQNQEKGINGTSKRKAKGRDQQQGHGQQQGRDQQQGHGQQQHECRQEDDGAAAAEQEVAKLARRQRVMARLGLVS